jgi:hypothetical protein
MVMVLYCTSSSTACRLSRPALLWYDKQTEHLRCGSRTGVLYWGIWMQVIPRTYGIDRCHLVHIMYKNVNIYDKDR